MTAPDGAGSKGAILLGEAAAIAAELGVRHPEFGDRFDSLAERLDRIAGTELGASPLALPLTAPIHRNALNLQGAAGDRFRRGIESLEEQVANLEMRAGRGSRGGG